MAASNRLDMALDAIIALDKKKANKGSARGRGASRGRGRPGGRTRGASVTPRGRGRGRGRPFTPTSRPIGLRGARGGGGGARGRGRGRGRVTSQRGRGTTVQGLRSAQSQAIAAQRKAQKTAINDARRNISANRGGGRGRGRGSIVRPTSASFSGRGRGRGGVVRGGGRNSNPRAKQIMANASVARARRTLAGRNRQGASRGRGRGTQGGRRGRGGRGAQDDDRRPQTQNVQIEVKQNVKPEGVLLSPDFGASHHTQVSLDNRFTPRNVSTQSRVVMSNGRSVAYQS